MTIKQVYYLNDEETRCLIAYEGLKEPAFHGGGVVDLYSVPERYEINLWLSENDPVPYTPLDPDLLSLLKGLKKREINRSAKDEIDNIFSNFSSFEVLDPQSSVQALDESSSETVETILSSVQVERDTKKSEVEVSLSPEDVDAIRYSIQFPELVGGDII